MLSVFLYFLDKIYRIYYIYIFFSPHTCPTTEGFASLIRETGSTESDYFFHQIGSYRLDERMLLSGNLREVANKLR
jgi:hypothetical protein